MSHVPHELKDDFPEFADKIHTLKTADAHFSKLADEYHAINREIHRIENGDIHMSQIEEDQIRKARMKLKDTLYAILKG